MDSVWLQQSTEENRREAEDTEELARFRKEWQEELRHGSQGQEIEGEDEAGKEREAASLYWMGVAAERNGDMHSAIVYYRQAVQLIPDIEFKIHSKDSSRHLQRERGTGPEEEEMKEGEDEEEEKEMGERRSEDVSRVAVAGMDCVSTLAENFHHMMLHEPVCQPERHTRGTQISALPREVLRLILRWVVSSQLNMRDLEQCSMVCRGFYGLAREPGIWRLACQKLWPSCNQITLYENSWRQMYIQRPHLHFNGVYISKISYVRSGERSLDGYYKPYHTVVYYRYLRFFPDGVVMYQTSPEDPAGVVGKLCHKHSSEAVLLGEYCLDGHKLTIDVLGYHSRSVPQGRQRGRERKEVTHEQRFHMELLMKRSRRQHLFNQLVWQEHYCHSLHRPSGHVQVSHFTIDYKYPPFMFSRVKSFSTNCRGML